MEKDKIDLNYRPPAFPSTTTPLSAALAAASSWPTATSWRIARPVLIPSRSLLKHQTTPRQIAERHNLKAYDTYDEMLASGTVEVVDIAVPPDIQFDVIKDICKFKKHVRGILAQNPLGVNFAEAKEIVRLCQRAKVTLAVNQNMRYDQSVRAVEVACSTAAGSASRSSRTIDMRAIPHWMPWSEELARRCRRSSCRSIISTRFATGSARPTASWPAPAPIRGPPFPHRDGINLYILEYANGAVAAHPGTTCGPGPAREGAAGDIGIRWRVEGTDGLARGTIGWPELPAAARRARSITRPRTSRTTGIQPRWNEVWFPDAFVGTMAQLLWSLWKTGTEPEISGRDNLETMALVDACYLSAKEHRAVEVNEIVRQS